MMNIDELVKNAINGDKQSLENVILSIQDRIYNLALRMLVNPEHAKDATQEILLKVITHLGSFHFKSQFTTWVYRIAANYLISEKKILAKSENLTFDAFKEDLEQDLQEAQHTLKQDPEYHQLLNELRISCTMAMLLCLNPPHRMAYILGDILELEHGEASDILNTSKANFRKQLSRARTKIVEFTFSNCGHVNSNAKCHCNKKITGAINRQRVQKNNLYFSNQNQISYDELKTSLSETKASLKHIVLQLSIKDYSSPVELIPVIDALVAEGLKKHVKLSKPN